MPLDDEYKVKQIIGEQMEISRILSKLKSLGFTEIKLVNPKTKEEKVLDLRD